jgi:prevent-host-death family protein
VDTVTLSDAKARLPRLLADVAELGEGVVITRSGRPAAVLVSIQEYEGLLETLEVLADPELSAAIRTGLDEAARGRVVGHGDLWRELGD